MAKLCHILSTICRCENQKDQPGMLKQRLMIEDKDQGRRWDHFDMFWGSGEQHEIISRVHDMCIMLRRCQRKAQGEVPMLDSFKLLPVRALLTDSLIVDNWIPQSSCPLQWHHLPDLSVRGKVVFAHDQSLSYPINILVSTILLWMFVWYQIHHHDQDAWRVRHAQQMWVKG